MSLPPGTILQLMYVRERLRDLRPGTFIEIGVGQGYLSRELLRLGWRGTGYEPDAHSAAAAQANNADAIREGLYRIVEANWLDDAALGAGRLDRVDLILSSMVLEHLDEPDEARYFARCAGLLAPGGRCMLLVPASMHAWGIEDEIAGHYRRYTFARFQELLPRLGWRIDHMCGLTFPLSNLLLPISNWLVARSESGKLALDLEARTRASGRREVYGKTVFPGVAAVLLNERVMYPFHLLQKAFAAYNRSLVIYVECTPRRPDAGGAGEKP